MEDNYIVKIYKISMVDKSDYYFYKNNLLHREEGSAILLGLTQKEFDRLKDRELYKKEFIPFKFPPGYSIKYFATKTPTVAIKAASYYLEGQPYKEEEFNNIKFKLDLKNELNNELLSKSNTNKPHLKPKI